MSPRKHILDITNLGYKQLKRQICPQLCRNSVCSRQTADDINLFHVYVLYNVYMCMYIIIGNKTNTSPCLVVIWYFHCKIFSELVLGIYKPKLSEGI